MEFFLVYLFLINAAGFALMLTDKYKAKNNLWRIPEKTFFAIALLGGSVGCLWGMYTVRHKTKHISFSVGLPLILSLQIISAVILLNIL